MGDQTNAVEKVTASLKLPSVMAAIRAVIPHHLKAETLIQIAATTVSRNETLASCTAMSVISAVVEASQMGLSLDRGLGQAYLVPFKNNKLNPPRYEATLMYGYRGLIHLARNSGLVRSVSAEIVLEGDEFSLEYGSVRQLLHKPNLALDRFDKKLWLGAYAIAFFNDGSFEFEYMPKAKILAHKNRARAKDDGPWQTDEDMMWRKTAIRRLSKYMPQSPQMMNFVTAATRDENRDLDIDVEPITLPPAIAAELPPESSNEGGKQEEKKENVKRKSDGKKDAAKADDKKATESAEPAEEMIGPGQIRSLEKLAYEEKNLTAAEFLQVLGNLGYEKLEQIPKSKFGKIWAEIASENVREKK